MKQLVPAALITFLLAVAFGRIWARRSLALLDVEQKARAMDASSRGHVWPFVCTAAAVAAVSWLPTESIPDYFRPGIFATCVMLPFLISVGAGIGTWIRLSRAGLPRPYLHSIRLQAIAFHVALLVLICAVIYYSYVSYVRRRDHPRQSSNQAMQLTASKPPIYAGDVCRRERMLRGMHRGLAAADLVSR